jgi:CelD/BcsL family acetyltransferase involved in cellulose biosynthesis
VTALPKRTAPLAALRESGTAAMGNGAARLRPRFADAPAGPAFASVAVHGSLDGAASAWMQLQATAAASPYQTLAWNRAWLETEGRSAATRPFICVARDERGRAVALLPLGLAARGPITVASFLGGRHSNYNVGLFDPAVAWSRGDVEALLRAAADASPVRPDLFALTNQPYEWEGWSNPLALLPGQASPSQSHRAELFLDGETFLRAHLSSSARKKMRNKAGHLQAMGPVTHLVGRSRADIEAILDAHVAQKAAKLASLGLLARTDLAATRKLLARAAMPGADGAAALELHALLCGERIVATFGALVHAGRVSGLVISHDAQAPIARLTPGELLLASVIRAKCSEGYAGFDLGIGEARYKEGFCPIADPLFDSLVPMTGRGRLFVAYEGFRLRLKGRIKQSRWAWPALKRLRKRLAGRRPAG